MTAAGHGFIKVTQWHLNSWANASTITSNLANLLKQDIVRNLIKNKCYSIDNMQPVDPGMTFVLDSFVKAEFKILAAGQTAPAVIIYYYWHLVRDIYH